MEVLSVFNNLYCSSSFISGWQKIWYLCFWPDSDMMEELDPAKRKQSEDNLSGIVWKEQRMWSGNFQCKKYSREFLKFSIRDGQLMPKEAMKYPKNSHFQLKENKWNCSLSTIFHNLLVLLLITFLFHAAAFIDLLSVPAASCYFTVVHFHLLPSISEAKKKKKDN